MSFKKTAAIIAASSGVSYAAYRAFTEEFFKRTFKRRDDDINIDQKYQTWFSTSNVVQVNVESFDGLKLNAYNVHNHDNNDYMILVHGIWNNSSSMYSRAYEFDKLGYNVLLIDQRSSGKSEGEYYTYGFKESLDLNLWINYLIQKYPGVNICLYGLSMGAATVMMTTANTLPDNVRCIVEDCGFSSVKEELEHVLNKDYNIAFTKIITYLLESKMKYKFGMSFDDISAKKCLENNEVPIMFIHGMADDYVPYEMSKILYNHNKGPKKFYPVPDAAHCEAVLDPEYFSNINAFIRTYFI